MKYCFAILLCILSLQIVAASEFKIIRLQHRLAEDILPSLQPFMQHDGMVKAMQNHLIIRASTENMAEIEQIIASLDVARQNFTITVSHENNLESSSNNLSLNGKKTFGNLEISSGPQRNKRKEGVQINISDMQTNEQNSSRQFITVTDGESAFIRVGQSIPFTQNWVTLTQRYASEQQTTQFINISTGFSVRARSIGNQIELEITPSIAQLNQNNKIYFEKLSTVVLIKQGEWLNLGGIMQQKDEVSRAILNHQNSQNTRDTQLQIRVD